MNTIRRRDLPNLAPWTALIGVWFLWGSTYIAIRHAVATIPPLLMGGSRYLTAGVILLLIYGAVSRRFPRVTARQLRSTAIAGAALLLGGNGLLSLGEVHLQSGVAALLIATVPLIMIVESAAVRRQWISKRSLIAITLGTAGVVILVGTPGSQIDYRAALVILVGAFFWASGSVYLANADMPANPVAATAFEMIFGGLAMLVAATAAGEWGSLHFASIGQASGFGWLWLVGPGAIVGFSAYTYALRRLPTSIVATYAYVNPVVAVVLGSALGDQPLTVGLLLGGAAVVGAVCVTLVKAGSREEAESSEEIPTIPAEITAEVA